MIIGLLFCLVFVSFQANSWGFYAHKRINHQAIFILPPPLIGFYKQHLAYITAHAIDPDQRRYVNPEEAPRHYIDIDVFGDSAIYTMPHYWKDAVAKFTEDTLKAYGIVPWYVQLMKYRLTQAFRERDVEEILKLSADMGHYVADANVPLHTTENYDGQMTGQKGIHGLWESRIPELYGKDFDLWTGRAFYLVSPKEAIWAAVTQAHEAVDSVLSIEKNLLEHFPGDKIYSRELRNGKSTQVYSRHFCKVYQRKMHGMVQRQMRRAISLVASFWYTCWVDAGQPTLASATTQISKEDSAPAPNPQQKGILPEEQNKKRQPKGASHD